MHDWGMAKLINDVLITLEAPQGTYIGVTGIATISSLTDGRTHEVSLGEVHNWQEVTKQPKAATVTPEEKTLADPPTPVLSAEAERMIRAAKDVERAKLEGAWTIQSAHQEAQQSIADAEHMLNRAIQVYLHTHKTDEDADTVLEGAGFPDLTERTDSVYSLDTAMLYIGVE